MVDAAIWLCLLAGTAASEEGHDPTPDTEAISVLGLRDPRLIRAVTLAVREASRRLDSPQCRQVFSDFSDAFGARLATNLEALRQSGPGYLRWLVFFNGDRESACERTDVALAVDPGSRLVAVCGVRFVALQREEPGYAAALVVHEELHVLGLRENPPSSPEITRRVIERCGR